MRYYEFVLEENALPIYRGEYSGNRGGNFWTPDRNFARQFTQSGRDNEVKNRFINTTMIFRPSEPVYAGNPDAVDIAIKTAKSQGFKAVWLDEGGHGSNKEPDSIYVFDKSALKFSRILAEKTILETRYAPLYHWMDAGKSYRVFKSDKLLPLFAHKMVGEKGISASRNKRYEHHNGDQVCLVFDQEKIRLTNKIVPLDSEIASHFDGSHKLKYYTRAIKNLTKLDVHRKDRNRNATSYDPPGKETAEEYIIGSLVPLHKYLKSIILYNWVNEEPFIGYLLAYVKKFNIPLEVSYMPKSFWRSYGDEVEESKSLDLPTIEVGIENE